MSALGLGLVILGLVLCVGLAVFTFNATSLRKTNPKTFRTVQHALMGLVSVTCLVGPVLVARGVGDTGAAGTRALQVGMGLVVVACLACVYALNQSSSARVGQGDDAATLASVACLAGLASMAFGLLRR